MRNVTIISNPRWLRKEKISDLSNSPKRAIKVLMSLSKAIALGRSRVKKLLEKE